jgi:hypothetical protein
VVGKQVLSEDGRVLGEVKTPKLWYERGEDGQFKMNQTLMKQAMSTKRTSIYLSAMHNLTKSKLSEEGCANPGIALHQLTYTDVIQQAEADKIVPRPTTEHELKKLPLGKLKVLSKQLELGGFRGGKRDVVEHALLSFLFSKTGKITTTTALTSASIPTPVPITSNTAAPTPVPTAPTQKRKPSKRLPVVNPHTVNKHKPGE